MYNRLKQMLIKEFLQMLRDPRMRIIIFGMPVIQLTILAFALTMDVTDIKTAVLDYDSSRTTREVIAEFTASSYFRIVKYARSQNELNQFMDQGKVRAIIYLPAGFENDLLGGKTAKLQVIADGTDSNSAAIVFGYASSIINQYSEQKIKKRLNVLRGQNNKKPIIEIETRSWFNPNLESKYYYVPGLIAIMLIVISMILSSIAIVREKEIGTIEQVMVTPIRRIEFIVGKTIPYLIIGYVVMTIMFGIAMVIFGIRVKGSWFLLYGLTGIYLAGNLGISLLISVSSSTQQQAMLTAFFIIMPAILLSGFIFPINNMPVPVQWITFLDPMRWYFEGLRGIVMKGVGIRSIWPAIMGQSALAVIFIVIATLRFKKTSH